MAENNGYGLKQRKNLVILYQQAEVCSIDMDMGRHCDLPKDSIILIVLREVHTDGLEVYPFLCFEVHVILWLVCFHQS